MKGADEMENESGLKNVNHPWMCYFSQVFSTQKNSVCRYSLKWEFHQFSAYFLIEKNLINLEIPKLNIRIWAKKKK